jgi:hypothetical protein
MSPANTTGTAYRRVDPTSNRSPSGRYEPPRGGCNALRAQTLDEFMSAKTGSPPSAFAMYMA